MSTPSAVRKKRNTALKSIARLADRLKDLEGKVPESTTFDLAKDLDKKLTNLDEEVRKQHSKLIDLIDEEEEDTLQAEQGVLDQHDDELAALNIRIKQLILASSASVNSGYRKSTSRKLSRIERSLQALSDDVKPLTDPADIVVVRQHDERLQGLKSELKDVSDSLLDMELEDTDDLCTLQGRLEKLAFDCLLILKRLSSSHPTPATSTPVDGKGVRLPKLDAPTFDGKLVNWRPFWDQFSIAIHDRSSLSKAEKLAYLRNSLKDGPAKGVIEGLSESGDFYDEAIESLKARFDRPRLIHQSHVQMIVEAPVLKEGTGRELRRLHDTVQQHLRALKAMSYEPSGPFITSMLELKLDSTTRFEWQKFSQDIAGVPHFERLLEFLDLRAQASESLPTNPRKNIPRANDPPRKGVGKSIPSFAANAAEPHGSHGDVCPVCKNPKHPLYTCAQFKALTHDQKMAVLKSHDFCINCLRPGHFVKQCSSTSRCRTCQKPHHTLMHIDKAVNTPEDPPPERKPSEDLPACAISGVIPGSLLMTCRVLVQGSDGSKMEARALLDSASSASFVSERLTQSLHLSRFRRNVRILGVAGLSHDSPTQSFTHFVISPLQADKTISVTAVIVPRVTCDLPTQPVQMRTEEWSHLADLTLADPDFGRPGTVDILLGVDIFAEVVRQGRRMGGPGSPSAFETDFGWVLAGETNAKTNSHLTIAANHTTVATGDDLLMKFWAREESAVEHANLSPEERAVVKHFEQHHTRTSDGRFVVPLPKKPHSKPIGESRSQAVRRFKSLERSLRTRGLSDDFNVVIEEYFQKSHAELVPPADLEKPVSEVFYLPMHVVRKESSTTTKIRAVFDASALSSSGVSLNDTLMVGPTIHPPLVDVLLRFRMHRVALTTDISRMYRAVLLDESDKDLHRFIWRRNDTEPLRDYRMTRVTFGVSASSYAANMAVKQNAADLALEYPLALKTVCESFYVDDGLTGADTVEGAISLQQQLQESFSRGGFLLRKWNSSNPAVLEHLPDELKDAQSLCSLPDSKEYTKTLGIEWNTVMDHFRLTIAKLPSISSNSDVTKRFLISDVAKTFDVLGWFAPCTIKMKILFQQLWELKLDWDDPVPESVRDDWTRWRAELSLLATKYIPRCYHNKETSIASMELHGFSDASEQAYGAVLYLRIECTDGSTEVTLVLSKTKVAPIKRLTIPRLELCGAHLLANCLHHAKSVLSIPATQTYAWTDSTIVLNWLARSPKRFKTYVGNRVSNILELVGVEHWRHVSGVENPADCASRGLFPSELLDHSLWWHGPDWLRLPSSQWPGQSQLPESSVPEEEREISLHLQVHDKAPIIPLDRYSSYSHLKRVTAWVLRFVRNCRAAVANRSMSHLTTQELWNAEVYWLSVGQGQHFSKEVGDISNGHVLHRSSPLIALRPYLDADGLLRVGGREGNSNRAFSSQHPVILHGAHPITRLIVRSEHLRLLHAGPTLLSCSLNRRYHILVGRKVVRSVTRACVICRRRAARPQRQQMGQLPLERVMPDAVFSRVGVDYAGPLLLKLGSTRKPTVVKAYVCVFVSLSVRAVHLELVSDLMTDAFIACLRRFMARRGKPTLIWSDHGTNFVGANNHIRELCKFLESQKAQKVVSEFCAQQSVQWQFIPEHAPHFGGLWEAAVKSFKHHLHRIVGNVRLTFEEMTTVLAQIEACLNSRPLVSLPPDDDGIDALTPGHFLVGRPLTALPDPALAFRSMSILSRWHLCQALVRHLWQRWSVEYLSSLQRVSKWRHPSRNLRVGDIVVLREDNVTPMNWPIARVMKTHPGQDGLVRVVTVKTSTGTYRRPVVKTVLLLSD